MLKRNKDIISGTILLIISIIYFIATFNVRQLEIAKFGARFIPQIIALTLFLSSFIIIVLGIKKAKNWDKLIENNEAKWKPNRGVIGTIFMLGIYIFFLEKIGFIIMTIIYLFGQITILANKEDRNLTLTLIISIISSVTIYYLFLKIFTVILPEGILG